MKAALIGPAPEHRPLYEARRSTPREQGPDAVVESVLAFAAELRAYGVEQYGTEPVAAGVCLPGIIDEAAGVALFAANLGWRDVPLRQLLSERLNGDPAADAAAPNAADTAYAADTPYAEATPSAEATPERARIPVVLSHDVRTGGLAEGRIGAGKGVDRFLFVPLGTGIAGAIGIDGKVEPGAHGGAGEIGHIVVRADGPLCGCGQRGCMETLCSAAAVGRAWSEACGDPQATAADAAKAVESGDPRAAAVWNSAIDALAAGLVTGLTLLDPRTLIIGGGLAEAGETLFAPLREAVRERATFQRLPTIVPAALGDAAGCLGAGLLAWDQHSAEVSSR
ncbi:ROK family protein [Streptomyces armeniacus]|uniref:ROK family protein n=1 Tax=Streptomyces armeniacus TaxID=83291 RepID=A0A345Y1A1_9ACTN|nr:ROK family protein [Streptomyces armeniacus]